MNYRHTNQSGIFAEIGYGGLAGNSAGLFFLQLGDSGQNLRAMFGGIDIVEDAGDFAVGSDQECIARGMGEWHMRQGAVFVRDVVIGIGEEFETEAFLDAKLLVRVRTVDADADDDGITLLVLGEVALKVVASRVQPLVKSLG